MPVWAERQFGRNLLFFLLSFPVESSTVFWREKVKIKNKIKGGLLNADGCIWIGRRREGEEGAGEVGGGA